MKAILSLFISVWFLAAAPVSAAVTVDPIVLTAALIGQGSTVDGQLQTIQGLAPEAFDGLDTKTRKNGRVVDMQSGITLVVSSPDFVDESFTLTGDVRRVIFPVDNGEARIKYVYVGSGVSSLDPLQEVNFKWVLNVTTGGDPTAESFVQIRHRVKYSFAPISGEEPREERALRYVVKYPLSPLQGITSIVPSLIFFGGSLVDQATQP